MLRAFATVGGWTMMSRILGFVRDVMIAAFLGAGPVAEAFFVVRFVYLLVVIGLLNDLGRHPEGRADEGVTFIGGARELAGDAEVC